MKDDDGEQLAARIIMAAGLRGEPRKLPHLGEVNDVWIVGDTVLRIARTVSGAKDALIEAEVMALLGDVPLLAPPLLQIGELEGTTYTVYARAIGETLGTLEEPPTRFADCFCELGRQLTMLHRIRLSGERPELLSKPRFYDPRKHLSRAVEARALDSAQRGWLEELFPRLEQSLVPNLDTLIHNDLHAWNVLARDKALAAMLDWGDAGYGHPAFDFAGLPQASVAPMLSGYAAAGGRVDRDLIATMLLQRIGVGLWEVVDWHALPLYSERQKHWWCWPVGGFDELRGFVNEVWKLA